MDFKNIHIGSLIKNQIDKSEISDSRISSFFNISIDHVTEMYLQQHLSTELLLKWSKLLEYDFFRIYSQHLILFSPPANTNYKTVKNKDLPVFRKNVYTTEIILFILGKIRDGKMSKKEVIETYKIPKTTLYKWVIKYNGQA